MDLDKTWQVGLKTEKTKPFTFPAKSRYGFRSERKKMGCRGVVFCHVYDARLLPLSLDRFRSNLTRKRVQVVAGDTLFHIPEKFTLRDRISRKNLFLGTLFVISLRVTGNVLRRLHSFHPLVDIQQTCLS